MDFLDALCSTILTAPTAFVSGLGSLQGKQSGGRWCPGDMLKSTPAAPYRSLDLSRFHELAQLLMRDQTGRIEQS